MKDNTITNDCDFGEDCAGMGHNHRCELCGEGVSDCQEICEAHDPKTYQEGQYEACDHGIVHGQCMLDHGWEMS